MTLPSYRAHAVALCCYAMDCRLAQAASSRERRDGMPAFTKMVGAATGASVAVGLLYWSFLWLVRVVEGSAASFIAGGLVCYALG